MQNKRSTYFDGPSFLYNSIITESTANDNEIIDEGNADDEKELDRNVQDAKEYIRDMNNSRTMLYYLEQLDLLPREYVGIMIGDIHNEFDFRHGVRYDPDNNELKIGNASIQFDGNKVVIGGITYKEAPELYELLFKKHPIGYKESDKKSLFEHC